jgi:hypothetical protein
MANTKVYKIDVDTKDEIKNVKSLKILPLPRDCIS